MWANVALPMPFITRMFAAADAATSTPEGYINQRLSGKDNSYNHRKTTIGQHTIPTDRECDQGEKLR